MRCKNPICNNNRVYAFAVFNNYVYFQCFQCHKVFKDKEQDVIWEGAN